MRRCSSRVFDPAIGAKHLQVFSYTGDFLSLFALYEALSFSKTMEMLTSQAGLDLAKEYGKAMQRLGDFGVVCEDENNLFLEDQTPRLFQQSLDVPEKSAVFPEYDPTESFILPPGAINDLDEIYETRRRNHDEMEVEIENPDDVIELPSVDVSLKENRMDSTFANDLAYQIMDVDPQKELMFYRPDYHRSVKRGKKRAFSEMNDEEKPRLVPRLFSSFFKISFNFCRQLRLILRQKLTRL